MKIKFKLMMNIDHWIKRIWKTVQNIFHEFMSSRVINLLSHILLWIVRLCSDILLLLRKNKIIFHYARSFYTIVVFVQAIHLHLHNIESTQKFLDMDDSKLYVPKNNLVQTIFYLKSDILNNLWLLDVHKLIFKGRTETNSKCLSR